MFKKEDLKLAGIVLVASLAALAIHTKFIAPKLTVSTSVGK
jgi:hypothetical protein